MAAVPANFTYFLVPQSQCSVSLQWDSDDVPHCRILSSDKAEWRLIPAALCRWRCCFLADQLWLITRIREEGGEEEALICSTVESAALCFYIFVLCVFLFLLIFSLCLGLTVVSSTSTTCRRVCRVNIHSHWKLSQTWQQLAPALGLILMRKCLRLHPTCRKKLWNWYWLWRLHNLISFMTGFCVFSNQLHCVCFSLWQLWTAVNVHILKLTDK